MHNMTTNTNANLPVVAGNKYPVPDFRPATVVHARMAFFRRKVRYGLEERFDTMLCLKSTLF